jgi:hypothetical protein
VGEEFRLIPLSNGGHAMVDPDMFEFLSKWKWRRNKGGYAIRGGWVNGRKYTVKMHRVVAGTPNGMLTDHINGNKLDNRRCNLRYATNAQNNHNLRVGARNKSGYKGVSWDKLHKTWRAEIRKGDTKYMLGYFPSKEQAALAYNEAATRLFGEYAHLNVVWPEYTQATIFDQAA